MLARRAEKWPKLENEAAIERTVVLACKSWQSRSHRLPHVGVQGKPCQSNVDCELTVSFVTSPAAILLMPCSILPLRSGLQRLSSPMRL